MAEQPSERQYAPLLISLNSDDDFKALLPTAKLVYFYLLIQPDLSPCGVWHIKPKKLARVTGLAAEAVQECLDELSAGRYVVFDADEETLWVRTLMRHDKFRWGRVGVQRSAIKACRYAPSDFHALLAEELEHLLPQTHAVNEVLSKEAITVLRGGTPGGTQSVTPSAAADAIAGATPHELSNSGTQELGNSGTRELSNSRNSGPLDPPSAAAALGGSGGVQRQPPPRWAAVKAALPDPARAPFIDAAWEWLDHHPGEPISASLLAVQTCGPAPDFVAKNHARDVLRRLARDGLAKVCAPEDRRKSETWFVLTAGDSV